MFFSNSTCGGLQHFDGPPATPHERAPRAHAANGLYRVSLPVEEHGVDRKSHKERVYAIASRNQKTPPRLKTAPPDKPLRSFKEGPRDFGLDSVDAYAVHKVCILYQKMVHLVGLEPTLLSELEPKSSVSAVSPQVQKSFAKFFLVRIEYFRLVCEGLRHWECRRGGDFLKLLESRFLAAVEI